MNFNTSPLAFFPSREAQIWRAWFAQRKISVVCGDELLPFYIVDNGTAPSAGELYDPNTDTKVADVVLTPYLLDHDITVDGQSRHTWIYQGGVSGVFGYTTAGYYYLKVGSWYSDVFKIGELPADYTEISWQFFDDIITTDGTPISKHIKYKQIFETPLWHPSYNIEEEGKTNNGIFFAMSQTTKKTSGFSAIVNESQLDCLNLTRMADNIVIKAVLNGASKTLQTNQFEIKSKWESDDVASIECEFDLFSIIRKYQQSNEEPEPLPIPTPPPTPSNYYVKGKAQSGISSIKLDINGTVRTIPVTNGEFSFGYDAPLTSLRTSTAVSGMSPDIGLSNVDKITELDLSETDGFGSATTVVLNQLKNCTTIILTGCSFASVTDVTKMFDGDLKVTALNMPSATFASVTQGALMFCDCKAMTSVKMPNATFKVGAYGMFSGCRELIEIDLRNSTFEDETTTGVMFAECKKLGYGGTNNIKFTNATFASVTECARMFDSATFYDTLNFSQMFPSWAAKPTRVEGMFADANFVSVTTISFDLSACTNGRRMFANANKNILLTDLDFSNIEDLESCFEGFKFVSDNFAWLETQTFAAAKITKNMFKNATSSTLTYTPNLTFAVFSGVTDASGMFEGSDFEEIAMPVATFASATNVSQMFYLCSQLKTVDISSATMASVTTATGIFSNCPALTDISLPSSATMPVTFSISQSASLDVDTFVAVALWVKDLTGLSAQTFTLNPTAVSTWSSNPSDALKFMAAQYDMTNKNWTVQY